MYLKIKKKLNSIIEFSKITIHLLRFFYKKTEDEQYEYLKYAQCILSLEKDEIRNMLYYFNIIKEDRDWDWIFICILLKAKLEKQRKYIEEYSYHVTKEKDIKNISIVIFLLNRIINDEYIFMPIVKKLKKINFKYGHEKQEEIEKQDNDMLFNILRKEMKNWWD